MTAQLLSIMGMYLGEESDLVPATAENPEGYWEHTAFVDVNDEILHELGGGWDCPVALPADTKGRGATRSVCRSAPGMRSSSSTRTSTGVGRIPATA